MANSFQVFYLCSMRPLLLILSLFPFCLFAQMGWTWTELPSMPTPVSNNAVTAATVGGVPYVYSFTGIDTTKLYSGINLGAYRYNTQTQVWETIAAVPDTLGKIAAGANTVNNIVYVFGGYHVFSNNNEISSDRVHRYDPENNVWLSDGAAIPVPIDDHVQAVWRDSLIFLVTGWSNSGNVTNVQIYDPANDSWQAGSSLPLGSTFTAFGASGAIVGDTIFYHGGASGFSFGGTKRLRRGIIDANDPTQITWDYPGDAPGTLGYRHAAITYQEKVFWIGGSNNTYNYNGIAYNGSGGATPLDRILSYQSTTATWLEGLGAPFSVMDLRGAAQLSPTSWVICGGMESGQQVSNRAFLLEYDPVAGDQAFGILDGLQVQTMEVYPNPSEGLLFVDGLPAGQLSVYDATGHLVHTESVGMNVQVNLRALAAGTYVVRLQAEEETYQGRFIKLP